MMRTTQLIGLIAGSLILTGAGTAQDWPQWRGPNRDAKATGFVAPKTWPKELTQKWKVTIGDGVATPALVGDKLYVFAREGGSEVVRCLEAGTGKEVWQDKYETPPVDPPAQGFSGPRSSPAVADGKVVTIGVHGILTCHDTAGKLLWRKDNLKSPRFAVGSSPVIAAGFVVVQIGGESSGGVVAYDVATGNEKWKWTEEGSAYASPVLLAGGKTVVAETDKSVVGLSLADGKLEWKTPFALRGRGYNAATPLVNGTTLILSGSGRGIKALKLGDGDPKEIWSDSEVSVQFNTPVLKDKLLFGISDSDKLFCLNAETGKTAWTKGDWLPAPAAKAPPAKGKGMMMRAGYGSVVDVGPVLMAMTPVGELVVFEPTDKDFQKLAMYKVATSDAYAYPVVAGHRVFVKDKDALTLWTLGD
jgi:outer membrane protein assembly factor BamB